MAPWTELPAQIHSVVAGSPDSVLLQTARFDSANRRSLLFCNPVETLTASELHEIPGLFRRIEEALAAGCHVAGYLSYECGYHFERFDRLAPQPQSPPLALPLAWFGVYRDPITFDHVTGSFEPWFEPSAAVEAPTLPARVASHIGLNISPQDYRASIRRIQQYIQAGDTYQVNFTDSVSFPVTISPESIFAALLKQQPVSYSAFLNIAGHHVLSLSPEFFFRMEDSTITTRPMKGTMPRGLDSAEDAAAALRLQNDQKNRAEHLMIVDLLRNDLGRICTMGSVRVEDIFSVERYTTLLQMTSTVSGNLRSGLSCYDIFKALFPSGSITGAPKIRTMQIIRELEQAPRGIYTGAIGYIAPDRSAAFNVAIRTLVLKDNQAHMGVGGGIVADSDPDEEYRECRLKAQFLTRERHDFQLIETMRWDGDFNLLTLHLDRLQSSADYFDFHFDREAVLAALNDAAASFEVNQRYRVRLLLHPTGLLSISSVFFAPEQSAGLISISSERTSSHDVFLRHKTTHRSLYDAQYTQARARGFDDILFLNERSELTEGAISNLFLEQQGSLFTPPLHSGVLPGVLRRRILETNSSAREKKLTLSDIMSADAIFLASSLRGLRRVKLVPSDRQNLASA